MSQFFWYTFILTVPVSPPIQSLPFPRRSARPLDPMRLPGGIRHCRGTTRGLRALIVFGHFNGCAPPFNNVTKWKCLYFSVVSPHELFSIFPSHLKFSRSFILHLCAFAFLHFFPILSLLNLQSSDLRVNSGIALMFTKQIFFFQRENTGNTGGAPLPE